MAGFTAAFESGLADFTMTEPFTVLDFPATTEVGLKLSGRTLFFFTTMSSESPGEGEGLFRSRECETEGALFAAAEFMRALASFSASANPCLIAANRFERGDRDWKDCCCCEDCTAV